MADTREQRIAEIRERVSKKMFLSSVEGHDLLREVSILEAALRRAAEMVATYSKALTGVPAEEYDKTAVVAEWRAEAEKEMEGK